MLEELSLQKIAEIAGYDSAEWVESVQSLWSGYGEVVRVRMQPSGQTAIVKHVCPPDKRSHKHGWANDVSHQRKLSSYANELAWYQGAAGQCNGVCRTAKLIGAKSEEGRWLMVFEDLDAVGFPLRRNRVNQRQVEACLQWLAGLHAKLLTDREMDRAAKTHGLWPIGTYWHLATRPDELQSMESGPLKKHAGAIDRRLNECRFQTVVHGDAKLANFCFAKDDRVAAVDFQYVGGGCGIKDVAYFLSSCLDEDECERRESDLLDKYFDFLGRHSLEVDAEQVEAEWREMYRFAWADFCRFLAGWSPGHWKLHRYSRRLADETIDQLS